MPFQYTPYRNQYVGSITDLMGRGRDAEAQALITAANAQAQAAQVSGQAWGGAVQGIGDIVGAIPGQMQAAEDREYLTAQRERVAEQQGREDLERAHKDRLSAILANQVSGVTPSIFGGIPGIEYTTPPVDGTESRNSINNLLRREPGAAISDQELDSMAPAQPLPSRQLGPAKHPYQVKQNGAWLFDIEGFHRAAAEAGPGVLEQAGPFIDQMSRMNTWRKGVTESAIAEAKQTAIFLSSLSDDSALLRAAPEAIRMFEGVFDQIALDSITDLAEQGDAVGLRKALNALTGREDQWLNLREGTDIFNPRTGERIKGPSAAPTPPTGDALDRAEWQRQVDAGLTTDSYPRWLTKEKTVDTPRLEPFDVLENEAGEQRYVRKGSPEAQELFNNGWTVQEDAVAPRPPSQAQFLASTYAGRMVQSEDVFARISDEIVGMNPLWFSGQQWIDSPTWQSDTMQAYAQAARNFINALLRRESGAVIAESEFDSAEKQYLPLPNDSEETTRQKAANRQYVTDTMIRSSGDAYEAPGGLSGDFTTQWDYDPDTQQNRLTYWHDGADGGIAGWYYDPPGMPFPQDPPGAPLPQN